MIELHYSGRLPNLNDIIKACRSGPFVANTQKKKTEAALRYAWGNAVKRHGGYTEHARIYIAFIEGTKRRDQDNVMAGMKFVLDALKTLGAIKDDAPKYCDVFPRVEYGERDGVKVTIIGDSENARDAAGSSEKPRPDV